MAKRRNPPLFEVLSAPDRRPGPGAMVGRPVRVEPPPQSTNQSVSPSGGVRLTPTVISLAVAVMLAVVLGVYLLAYKLGEKQKFEDVKPFIDPSQAASTNPSGPLNPSSAGGSGLNPTPPSPVPEPPPVAETPTDPRKPGNNYLQIVTLLASDADKAAAYLTKNGVPAGVAPSPKLGKIDLTEARAKNLALIVFALEPIPSGQFTASASKKQTLTDKVRSIGKKWQREEKGPSDFGEPMWALYK